MVTFYYSYYQNWQQPDNATHLMDRGFYMHRHLDCFHLINMEGRMYDPVVAQFLSPDPYVQAADNTQNLNRYAYCMNNPIMFSDLTGEKLKGWQWGLIALGGDILTGGLFSSFAGATYHFSDYVGESGWEGRVGEEWQLLPFVSCSGTVFSGDFDQSLNKITVGDPLFNVSYENDYMFNVGKYMFLFSNADNGDRYRSDAVQMNFGLLSLNLNMFTGDPDVKEIGDRDNYKKMIEGHITFTGGTCDAYRAGVITVGFGCFRIGRNSKQIRCTFQNKFAHDFVMQGEPKWFRVLHEINPSTFISFGTGTGDTLW